MSALAVRGLFVVAIVVLAVLTRPARADTVSIEYPVVTPFRPSFERPALRKLKQLDLAQRIEDMRARRAIDLNP